MDWPEWTSNAGTYEGYCEYAMSLLREHHAEVWRCATRRHSIPVPHATLMTGPSTACERALELKLSWSVLMRQRAHVRIRCGLPSLGHVGGRASKARVQQCLYCDELVSNTWVHVFGCCPMWNAQRDAVTTTLRLGDARSWDVMYSVLTAFPGQPQYISALTFIDAVLEQADRFWNDI